MVTGGMAGRVAMGLVGKGRRQVFPPLTPTLSPLREREFTPSDE